MKFFADPVIKPYISAAGYRDICEIGASLGENTEKLLEIESVRVAVIDPCLDADLQNKARNNRRLTVHKGLSLDVLAQISGRFDCILIDGDHNWYTVYNELQTIERRNLLREGGTIFLHDVDWPYGRRDMYYQPETIPGEFVHVYAAKGIVRGQSELSEDSGINSERYNALFEGGSRNGVLTAVEDFLRGRNNYLFFCVHEQHGLGVLHKRKNISRGLPFIKLLIRVKYPGFARVLHHLRQSVARVA